MTGFSLLVLMCEFEIELSRNDSNPTLENKIKRHLKPLSSQKKAKTKSIAISKIKAKEAFLTYSE